MKTLRILYVEDSESHSRSVKEAFLTAHQVVHCMTLEEARAAYAPGSFDLIILDYDLPDGDGETLAEIVRGGGDMVLIVANSNSLRKNHILMDLGANHVVTKGEEPDKLAAILESL